MVGFGVTSTFATRSAGKGITLQSYTRLSHQIADDVQVVYQSVRDIQDKLDFLAEMVLQNRLRLDLLTSDKEGICIVLQGSMWFCKKNVAFMPIDQALFLIK